MYGVWGEVSGDFAYGDGVFGTVLPPFMNTGDAGVHGICDAASNVWGFQGLAPIPGPTDYGVWGDNASGTPESVGVFGTVLGPLGNSSAGVWGINNGPISPPRLNPFPPVPAPIESAGPDAAPSDYGVRGMTDSAEPGSAGVLGETEADYTAGVYGRCPYPWADPAGPGCFGVFSDGDMMTNGSTYATGVKFAIFLTSQGWEGMIAVESMDVEFYANGEAQLQDGAAVVEFERLFREAISPDVPVRVIVTPVGGWSGLYVESADPDGFVVMSGAGDPNVTFNWIAIGRRKGYEDRPELNMSDPAAWAPETATSPQFGGR